MGLRFIVEGADFSGLGLGNAYTPADNFIINAGITNFNEEFAIRELYDNLKNAGIFDKAYGIYPFIGSTNTTQKWNLKNPLDTNVAGRLTFLSGSSSPAGFNGAANTNLSPINNSDVTLAIFNSAGAPAGGSNYYLGGVNNTGGTSVFIARQNDVQRTGGNAGSSSVAKVESLDAVTTKTGLLTITRGSSTLQTLYDGATAIATDAVSRTITNPTAAANVYLGRLNVSNAAAGSGVAINFAFFGKFLTASEVNILNNSIITFNSRIGR